MAINTIVAEQRARIEALSDYERRAIAAETQLQVPHSAGKKKTGGNGSEKGRGSSKSQLPGLDL